MLLLLVQTQTLALSVIFIKFSNLLSGNRGTHYTKSVAANETSEPVLKKVIKTFQQDINLVPQFWQFWLSPSPSNIFGYIIENSREFF